MEGVNQDYLNNLKDRVREKLDNVDLYQYKGSVSKQDIFDIEVDDNGFVYGLESAFGKVFVYDSSCRILSVFGGGMGFGTQVGTFVTVGSGAEVRFFIPKK